MFKQDDFVYRFHDTGCMGASIVFGRVMKICPKTYLVKWEFGNLQYVRKASFESECGLVTGKDELDFCKKKGL